MQTELAKAYEPKDVEQRWYAYWRALRFARHLGFAPAAPRDDGPGLKGDEDVGLFTWLFGKKEGTERAATPAEREQKVKSEVANVKHWRESGQPQAWVEAHNGQWNHADWLALLEELKRSPFWPMHPDAVGQALEDAKRDWLRRN